MAKLTLDEFRARYSRKLKSDEDYADAIIANLPADSSLAKAAQQFLEVCKAFDAAMEAARIDRE